MNINAHFVQPPAEIFVDQLISRLDSQVRLTTGQEELAPADTTILIAGRPTRELLAAGPMIRSLIIPWAGLPDETGRLLVEFPDITVHNLHHNAQPVAEMVLALLLGAAKLVLPFDRLLRRNDWTPRYEQSQAQLLAGKTALILGYGSIGHLTAGHCKALGMRVLATRRRPNGDSDGPADEVYSANALHDLLPEANALLICLPHTSETDGLIGQKELALLREKSILVNVGRGPIVDQEALYLALQSRHLHAAGLDVWYNYPTDSASRKQTSPADFPFRELDNIIMSPHRAGSTAESNALRMAHLADLLNAAAAGEEMPNRVNLAAGY